MKYFLNNFFYRNKILVYPNQEIELTFYGEKKIEKIISDENVPKIIWTYWHDLTPPKSVQICLASWHKNNSDYEIRLLNKETINTYLVDFNFQDYNVENLANLSDIIRLKLLVKYGGIWLDASVFLNKGIDCYLEILESNQLDLLCFMGLDHNNLSDLPITESWFLITKKNNELIIKWLEELDKCFKSIDYKDYFKTNYQDEYLMINEHNRDYLHVYIASLIVLKRLKSDINIGLLNSKNNGFYYNYAFNFNYSKIAKYFLLNTIFTKEPAIIKLTNKNRILIDFYIAKGLVRKKSLFGQYI